MCTPSVSVLRNIEDVSNYVVVLLVCLYFLLSCYVKFKEGLNGMGKHIKDVQRYST